MNLLKKLFGGSPKPRTLLDDVQEAGGKIIVGAYRKIAAQENCAPTAKTTDQKIIEIYSKVGTAFQQTADRRHERISALNLNAIVFKFLQVHETMGEEMLVQHLQYEVDRYLDSGLRPEYKREMSLTAIVASRNNPEPAGRRQGPSRIVLVYDQDGPRQSIELIFRREVGSVDLISFADSLKAWEELSRTAPDLLITNDVMAGLSGQEMVERLAARQVNYPIIVLSGYRDWPEQVLRDYARRGLRVSFLAVPFDITGFVRAVETALKRAGEARFVN